MLYAAYGSNMDGRQMGKRCPGAESAGKGFLRDHVLEFRGRDGNAHATIAPAPGSSVPVLLWRLTKEDEESLDEYEEYPGYYHKETMDVDTGDGSVSAMVYIMNPRPYGRPRDGYYRAIEDVYRENGFDLCALRDALERSSL